jgi:uridine phosphorylase
MSKFGLGLDNMLRSYLIDDISNTEMEDAFVNIPTGICKGKPYVISCSEKLEKDRKRQNTQRNNSYS